MSSTAKPAAKKASTKKTKATNVFFFGMSLKRVFLLTLFTGGLYQAYWFYKNWKAVKIADQSKIRPFWRTVFSIFYTLQLFRRIKLEAQKHGYAKKFSPGAVFGLILGMSLVGLVIGFLHNGFNPLISIAFLMLSVASTVPTLLVQQVINFNNQHAKDSGKNRPSAAEAIIVVLGVCMFISSAIIYALPGAADYWATAFLPPQMKAQKQKADRLYKQYESCIADLKDREANLNPNSQYQLNRYNYELNACEAIRLEQNRAVDSYHSYIR